MDKPLSDVLLSCLPDAQMAFSARTVRKLSGKSSLISKSQAIPVLSMRGVLRTCVIAGRVVMYVDFSHGGARANSGGARPGAGRPRKLIAPPVLLTDVPHWYCLRTEFDRELSVDIAVRMSGVTVFNPSVYRPPVPARRDRAGIMRPSRRACLASMFPRFMFVQLNLSEPSWHDLKRIAGVERIMGLVGNFGVPAMIPDATILLIRSFLEPNDCCYPGGHPDLKHTAIEIGTAQRLLTGALQGQEGICTWSNAKRVKLLMTILGRSVTVTAERAAIEAV